MWVWILRVTLACSVFMRDSTGRQAGCLLCKPRCEAGKGATHRPTNANGAGVPLQPIRPASQPNSQPSSSQTEGADCKCVRKKNSDWASKHILWIRNINRNREKQREKVLPYSPHYSTVELQPKADMTNKQSYLLYSIYNHIHIAQHRYTLITSKDLYQSPVCLDSICIICIICIVLVHQIKPVLTYLSYR